MKYSAQEYIGKARKYLVPMPGEVDLIITEARGSIIKDIDGKEYIDLASMVAGPTGIGNTHPRVVEAVKAQVERLPCASPWLLNAPRVELAEKLAKITPGNLNKFYFLLGGGEAVENAIQNAMRITGKQEVIGIYLGYHGATIATLSLGQPWHRVGLPTVPGFKQIPAPYCYRCPFGKEYPNCDLECAKALEDAIEYGSYGNVAAFIMEPMLGNGGHIIPPKGYFDRIRDICDKHGVLLILDEIQTGFGRTGKMWGADYHGVQPDIMVMGKMMGGGIPISGVAYRDDFDFPSEGKQGSFSTFAGSPLSCAAASAVIDVVIEEKLPEKAAIMGEFLKEELLKMQDKHPLIGDVRCAGLFCGIELVKDRKTKEKAVDETQRVIAGLRENGVLTLSSNKPGIGNVVKIKPPLTIEKDLLKQALDVLDMVLSEVEGRR